MLHRLSRIRGFHVGATDGPLGHIDDFIVDEATWQIRYLVIDTSNWLGGKWVAVSPTSVTGIEWAQRRRPTGWSAGPSSRAKSTKTIAPSASGRRALNRA